MIDQVLVVHQVGTHARNHAVAIGVEDHLVGHGRHVVRPVGQGLAVGDQRLAALAETRQGGTEFLGLRNVHVQFVRLEIDELDLGVGGGELQRPDGVEEGDARAHVHAAGQRIEGEGFLPLFSDRLGQVHFQDGVLGNDRFLILPERGDGGSDDPEKEQIDQQQGEQRSEATAEYDFPEGFHILIYDDLYICILQI